MKKNMPKKPSLAPYCTGYKVSKKFKAFCRHYVNSGTGAFYDLFVTKKVK